MPRFEPRSLELRDSLALSYGCFEILALCELAEVGDFTAYCATRRILKDIHAISSKESRKGLTCGGVLYSLKKFAQNVSAESERP